MSKTILSLLSLAAAFAPTTLAQYGNAYITNDCTFPIYVQHVDQLNTSVVFSIPAGDVYVEPIVTNPGVTLKAWLSPDVSQPDIELDYTLATGAYRGLYYQLGGAGAASQFTPYGYGTIPSEDCAWDFCNAGDEACVNAPPTATTNYCDASADLNFYLCSG